MLILVLVINGEVCNLCTERMFRAIGTCTVFASIHVLVLVICSKKKGIKCGIS